jgi:hypothetical protein
MYSIADYVMTDEHYQGRAPMAVETSYLNQTVVIGFGDWTAQQAATYTNTAWSKGFRYSWHEINYNSLPWWLESYTPLLSSSTTSPAPAPAQPTTLSSGQINGTVASAPVSSGTANQYSLFVKIASSTVSGVLPGQQVWVAASTIDFPNLLTVGSAVNASLDKSLGWWVMKPGSGTTVPATGNTTAVVASTPVSSGAANQYSLNIRITATTATGLTVGQTVWVAASTTDFPNLFTTGSTLSGTMDKSLGWWILKASTTPAAPAPVPQPVPAPTTGNTTAVVVSTPVSSGAANQYNLNIRITATTAIGLTVGQTVWIAASTTDFPNLRTVGSTISGNMDKSLGWWVIKKVI